MEFCKIALIMPVDADHPRPDKWDWRTLTDHPHEVEVLACEYLTEDELPATADFAPTSESSFEGVWDAEAERFTER